MQPVCTTEIGRLALKYDELAKKGVKLATLSCDPVCSLLSAIPLSSSTASCLLEVVRSWMKYMPTLAGGLALKVAE